VSLINYHAFKRYTNLRNILAILNMIK